MTYATTLGLLPDPPMMTVELWDHDVVLAETRIAFGLHATADGLTAIANADIDFQVPPGRTATRVTARLGDNLLWETEVAGAKGGDTVTVLRGAPAASPAPRARAAALEPLEPPGPRAITLEDD